MSRLFVAFTLIRSRFFRELLSILESLCCLNFRGKSPNWKQTLSTDDEMSPLSSTMKEELSQLDKL